MFPRLIAAFLLVFGLTGQVLAQTLDQPEISVLSSDRSSITFLVQAGASGAPGGFVVQWMLAERHRALGGWPADGVGVQEGVFVGLPTLNSTPETGTYRLDPSEVTVVVLGQLFDETGVTSTSREELKAGTEYAIRVRASAGDGLESSPPSKTLTAATTTPGPNDCTLTQGYWKNHPESWLRVASIMLGDVTYSRLQLLAIFAQPAKGNGLVSLAHQLIAAKLNLLLGVVPPPEVGAALFQADALIGAKVVPPIGSGSLSPGLTAGLTDLLDSFNSGALEPGHCPDSYHPLPARTSTWGTLKSLYR